MPPVKAEEQKQSFGRQGYARASSGNGLPLNSPSPDDVKAHQEYGKFDFKRLTTRCRQYEMDSDDEFNMDRVEKYKKVVQRFEEIDWNLLEVTSLMPHTRPMMAVKFKALSDSGLSSAMYALTYRPDGNKLLPWEISLWGVMMRGFWAVWPDYDTPMHMAVDFINEKFDNNSIKLIDSNTQKMFRDMARQKSWPNCSFGGHQIAEASKNLVQRLAGKPTRASSTPGMGGMDSFLMALMMGSQGHGHPALQGAPTPPESEAEMSCAEDMEDPSFDVQQLPGRGLGAVASRDIPRGDTILMEKPLLDPRLDGVELLQEAAKGNSKATPAEAWFAEHYPLKVEVGSDLPARMLEKLRPQVTVVAVRGVTAAFRKLPQQKQSVIMSLYDRYESELGEKTPYGVFMTNSFGKGAGAMQGAVFNLSSRVNHSCRPNAYRNFDREQNRMRLYACRDIVCGEEICIAYKEVLATRAERQAELREPFGFDCACEACLMPSAEAKASDQRRLQMQVLDERILQEGAVDARHGLKLVREYEKLYEAEQLQMPVIEQRFCYDGFQFAAALGDVNAAKAWIDRVVRASKMIEMPGSAALQKHLQLQRNVKAHPVWGRQVAV